MCDLLDQLAQKQRAIDRLRLQIASTSATPTRGSVTYGVSGAARSLLDEPLIDLASVTEITWRVGEKKQELFYKKSPSF